MRDDAQLNLFDRAATEPPVVLMGQAAPTTRDKSRVNRPSLGGARSAPARISPSSGSVASKEFQLISFDEVDFTPTTMDLVSGLLPNSGLAVVYGPSGSGKSFVALDVALHVATGRPYAGRKVKPSGVIYIAAEGAEGFRRRVVAARGCLDAQGVPFAMIADAPDLGGSNDVDNLLRAVRAHTAKAGWTPGMVVIDTLARAMPGLDENSSRDMGTFIANVDQIGRELGCLMLVVHHTGKNEGAGMRGSSALRGAADVVWSIGFEDGVRVVSLEKSRDGMDNLRWSFDLEELTLATCEGGKPLTTCIVVGVTHATPMVGRHATKSKTPKSTRLFFDAFDTALVEYGEDIRPGGNDGRQVRAVRQNVVQEAFVKHHVAEKLDSRRRAFERSLKQVLTFDAIASVDIEGVRYLFKP